MNAHDVLVKVHNGIESDGWDVMVYGEDSDCGSPRCILGWAAHSASLSGGEYGSAVYCGRGPSHWREALTALWENRPDNYVPGADAVEREDLHWRVEDVAFSTDPRGGKRAVLAWIDQAIAATAPQPADPFGSLPAEAPELEKAVA